MAFDDPNTVQAARELRLPDDKFSQWKQCWEPYRNPRHRVIRAAEQNPPQAFDASMPWTNRPMIVVNGAVMGGYPVMAVRSPRVAARPALLRAQAHL